MSIQRQKRPWATGVLTSQASRFPLHLLIPLIGVSKGQGRSVSLFGGLLISSVSFFLQSAALWTLSPLLALPSTHSHTASHASFAPCHSSQVSSCLRQGRLIPGGAETGHVYEMLIKSLETISLTGIYGKVILYEGHPKMNRFRVQH